MIQNLLAAVIFIVCVISMIRLLVGARRRGRMDAFFIRSWLRIKLLFSRRRPQKKNPADLAEEAIRRAKDGGTWDGNVYKPKSFKGPRKPH